MEKKTKFFKKLPFFFAFQQSFYVQNAKILFISFQKQQMDYDYTKLLQLFIKPRHFHTKKNEINIVTKLILSKILAVSLHFLFIFKYFFPFLQFNSQNIQTNFVSYQKPFVSLCFVKKIELLRFVSRETSGGLLPNIFQVLYVSRETKA